MAKTLWDFCGDLARQTIKTTPPDVLCDICAMMDKAERKIKH